MGHLSCQVRGTVSVLIFFAVSCDSPVSAQTRQDFEQHDKLLMEYIRVERTGKWDDAVAPAERYRDFILQRFPKRLHFQAYEPLAQIQYLRGEYNASLKAYLLQVELFNGFRPLNQVERHWASAFGSVYAGVAKNLNALERHEEAIPFIKNAVAWWDQSNHPNAAATAAQGRSDLGTTFLFLDQLDKAVEQYRMAVVVLERLARQERPPGHTTLVLGETLRNWADGYAYQGRFDLAEPKMRRALQLIVSVHGWRHPNAAYVVNRMGAFLERQGRWNEAAPYYREAIRAYEATGGTDHPFALSARSNVARILRNQEKYDEAEAEFRRLVEILEASPVRGTAHSQTQSAYVNLATTCSLQGKHDTAIKIAERLLKLRETAEHVYLLGISKSMRNQPGDYTGALQLFDRCLQMYEQDNASPFTFCHVQMQRAIVLWSLGRNEQALAAGNEAIRSLEVLRTYSSGAQREQASVLAGFSWQFDVMAEWQAEQGDVAELFSIIERKKARSFLDELRLKDVNLFADIPAVERQRLTERTDQLRRRLSEAESQRDALPDPGDNPSEELKGRYREALRAVYTARDALYQHLTAIRASSPTYRELITQQTETPSISDVQQQLAHDELMLAYHVGANMSSGERQCYVVAIRAAAAELHRLQVSEQTAGVLGIEAGPLTGGKLSKALLDEDAGVVPALSDARSDQTALNKKLSALWTTLIPEDLREELTERDIELLTLSPAGPLALLPFEALVVSSEPETEYLLDNGPPIAYAPSASVLLNLTSRKSSDELKADRVLTLGDPDYSQPVGRTDPVDRRLGVRRADVEFRASLKPLPYSGIEADWVKQVFDAAGMPAIKLKGRQATEAELRRLIAGREIIHFACHGLARHNYGNIFGELAIARGQGGPDDDGYLSMAEIYDLELDGCELAILSACETNYGPQQKGEGVWALSRGFLVAGARRVVASNWVVDDRAGATLISYFTSYLSRAGKDASARDYATSLRDAKRLIRGDDKYTSWSHPFYWSSLVLVGPN